MHSSRNTLPAAAPPAVAINAGEEQSIAAAEVCFSNAPTMRAG